MLNKWLAEQMGANGLAKMFIRVGLAFVFVYASVEIYFHPDNFLKFVPMFIYNIMPIDYFLIPFGIGEVILAGWLLTGWKGKYSSFLSILIVMGIVVFNMQYFQILFRNIAIGLAALALFMLERVNEESAERNFL